MLKIDARVTAPVSGAINCTLTLTLTASSWSYAGFHRCRPAGHVNLKWSVSSTRVVTLWSAHPCACRALIALTQTVIKQRDAVGQGCCEWRGARPQSAQPRCGWRRSRDRAREGRRFMRPSRRPTLIGPVPSASLSSILPPIRGSQPEVIRSCCHHHPPTHHHKVFAGRLNARGTRTRLPRRAGGARPARRRRETLERRRRRSRAALLP